MLVKLEQAMNPLRNTSIKELLFFIKDVVKFYEFLLSIVEKKLLSDVNYFYNLFVHVNIRNNNSLHKNKMIFWEFKSTTHFKRKCSWVFSNNFSIQAPINLGFVS